MTSPPTYIVEREGNRLNPPRHHARFHVLTGLAVSLRRIAARSDIPGDLIVDFGCGERPYESVFAPHFARYLGVDLPGNTRADDTLRSDGRMPLDDHAADCVLSSQVLEHVSDPAGYLQEAHRVLREGGHLVLSTHGVWQYHPDPVDYWRWTGAGLRHQIERAGFTVLEVEGVLGPTGAALQLLQDSFSRRGPRRLRRPLEIGFQAIIGFAERREGSARLDGASVYVVLARRET